MWKNNPNHTRQDTNQRKWGWTGHTLWKPEDTIGRQALEPSGEEESMETKADLKISREEKDAGIHKE